MVDQQKKTTCKQPKKHAVIMIDSHWKKKQFESQSENQILPLLFTTTNNLMLSSPSAPPSSASCDSRFLSFVSSSIEEPPVNLMKFKF